MKRAVIFAHYDRDNLLDDYVLYYLTQLRSICEWLVFVTTANISRDAIDDLNDICCKVIVRDNAGHDFMSYKVGLECLNVREFDELVLCNDSVYGPIYPLVNMFEKMKNSDCSFWGVTQSFEISHHIQSYFLVFRKDVLTSSCFPEFWKNVARFNNREQIIINNEIGLSRVLIEKGFKAKVFVDYKPRCSDLLREMNFLGLFSIKIMYLLKILFNRGCGKCNVTHLFWSVIVLRYKMPFMKVDLLRDNYLHLSNLAQYKEMILKTGSDYPVDLIEKHLLRMANKSLAS